MTNRRILFIQRTADPNEGHFYHALAQRYLSKGEWPATISVAQTSHGNEAKATITVHRRETKRRMLSTLSRLARRFVTIDGGDAC